MRMMFDSITAADIPAGSELVAGYIDGFYEWTADEWALFPGRGKVRVAAMVATNDGDVLDVEYGDAWPSELPGWLTMRRATGADPSAYINLANWQACKDACAAAAVAEPHWWLAHYDGDPSLPDGAIAKQYANATFTGGHYDASVVADFWPGIDGGKKVNGPILQEQSADLHGLAVGTVGTLTAIFKYPNGRVFTITKKVIAYDPEAERKVVMIYPPIDPDADETLALDCEPAVFVIDVAPS